MTAPAVAQATITSFISPEVGGDVQASRLLADQQDDAWRAAAANAGLSMIAAGHIDDPTLPSILSAPDGTRVDVSLRDVSDADVRVRPNGVGLPAAVQGSAGSAIGTTMQDEAPKPQSLLLAREPYYNEGSGTIDERNGLLFTFTRAQHAFGAWFGDLETRNDGKGMPAFVRLLDERGRRIGNDIPVLTSTADPSKCGSPVDDAFVGCGNRSTRWIGFVSDSATPVKQVLVVVGDDDSAPNSDDAQTEHLSFIGATLGMVPTTSTPTQTGTPVPIPSATVTPEPTETATPTRTPSPTLTSTRIPTATPTAMPSPTSTPRPPTATPVPGPIYLPILLREVCLPSYVDVALVLDVSTSMLRPTRQGGATKLSAALEAARRFVGLLRLAPDREGRGDRAAVVWFNAAAAVEQGMTTDAAALGAALDRLPTRTGEMTRLDLALRIGAAAALERTRPGSVPVVVLLTDGLPNGVPPAEDGRPETRVLRAAAEAKAAGVRIYTIGLGAPDDLDAALLREAATAPADFSYAPDAEDLRSVYANLAASLRCIPGPGSWRGRLLRLDLNR